MLKLTQRSCQPLAAFFPLRRLIGPAAGALHHERTRAGHHHATHRQGPPPARRVSSAAPERHVQQQSQRRPERCSRRSWSPAGLSDRWAAEAFFFRHTPRRGRRAPLHRLRNRAAPSSWVLRSAGSHPGSLPAPGNHRRRQWTTVPSRPAADVRSHLLLATLGRATLATATAAAPLARARQAPRRTSRAARLVETGASYRLPRLGL
jgi:hypothetical protein